MGKADDRVGGVDTDADDIDRRLVEVVHEMIIFVRASKCERIYAGRIKETSEAECLKKYIKQGSLRSA